MISIQWNVLDLLWRLCKIVYHKCY